MRLQAQGVTFASDTDTEVIVQLIAMHYEGDLAQAVRRAIGELTGAWALAVAHRDHPGQLVVCAHESPLAIGLGESEAFVSSDPHAFGDGVQEVLYLSGGEIAIVVADGFLIYDAEGRSIERPTESLAHRRSQVGKAGFAHYMLKEIFEQPSQTVQMAMLSRLDEEFGTAKLEGLKEDLLKARRVLILAWRERLACGICRSLHDRRLRPHTGAM